MRIPGRSRLRRAVQWLRNRFVQKSAILLYHRVAEPDRDPQLLCVSARRFAEHLEILKREFHPLSLASLADGLGSNRIPERAVAVTFDDGYADNLLAAKPILERLDVPATIFVSTGPVHEGREFWWDRLERLILDAPALPRSLSLELAGAAFRYELPSEGHAPHGRWTMLDPSEPCPRETLFRGLFRHLRLLPPKAREDALEALSSWAALPTDPRPGFRPLHPEEVASLAAGDLIEVGSHTVRHPALSGLRKEEQWSEIEESRRRLRDLTGKPVESFAYPFGSRQDYTAETCRLVREAGYCRACANVPEVAWRGSDPYQLPRFLVRDWDGEEFRRRLEGWLRG